MFTSSAKDLSVGFPGATKFLISLYVLAPHELNKTARFFLLSVISFAVK